IFPTRLDIACQFNELNVELCEDTIQQFHTLLSSRSSTSSNNSWKCDRQIDISFQFLNPSMRLKMNDIKEWFIWQINFFKISFHSNQNSETKTLIELKNMLIYTSNNNNILSQSLIDDLSRQHLWNCLFYLPHANITISNINTTHIQIEITGIRLQSNHILISFLKRLQIILSSSKKTKTNSNRFIEISLHMKSVTVVICDTVPVYLCLSISTIRATRTQMEMKKSVIFFNNQSSDKVPLTSLTHGQKVFDVHRISIQHHSNNYTIKISLPHDLTFVLSTKLYLFLYRCISSFKFNNGKTTTVSNSDDNNNKSKKIANDIEFKVDKCARIHLQLSTDCRYIEKILFI
ncbi:unnamed protein product, partial [Rotaria sp. Silwood2]